MKQGDGLSTVLLNFTLEYVIRKLFQESKSGISFDGISQILGYENDLDLVIDYKETVTKNAEIFIKAVKDSALVVSEPKTKYMITSKLEVSKIKGIQLTNLNI